MSRRRVSSRTSPPGSAACASATARPSRPRPRCAGCPISAARISTLRSPTCARRPQQPTTWPAALPASPCPGRCAVCWSMPAGWEWTFGSGDCSRRSTCSWAPRPTWATSPAAWGSNPGVRAAAACRERSRRRTCAWATCSGAATCWAMRPSGRVSTGRSVAALPTHGSRAMSCG